MLISMPAKVEIKTIRTSDYIEITALNFTDLYIRQIMTSIFLRKWIMSIKSIF